MCACKWEFFGVENRVAEVGAFGGVELVEVGDFAVGDREQVAGVVRVAVHQHVAVAATMNDEGAGVVAQRGQVGKGTLGLGIPWRGDVFHPPIRVQLLHLLSAPTAAQSASRSKAKDRVSPSVREGVRYAANFSQTLTFL